MDTIKDVLFWIASAQKELAEDLDSCLDHLTTEDPMSEFRGWDVSVNQVYTRPSTLEEVFLRAEVYSILLTTLKNTFRALEKTDQCHFEPKIDLHGLTALYNVYRIGFMVAFVDPAQAPRIKVRLNDTCAKGRESLSDLERVGFYFGFPGKEW